VILVTLENRVSRAILVKKVARVEKVIQDLTVKRV
jgi:hypothetical protein